MKISKIDFSILGATAADHFASSLYLFLAPVFAESFMPNYDPYVQLMLAYSFLASSIFTHPAGAYIFGRIASKMGPIRSLSHTLLGIAIINILTAILPSYKVIGAYSTFLLIFLRTIGGIFSAGESTIAKIYIMENKEDKISFRASYMYPFSSSVGTVCSSILCIFFYEHFRMLFLLSGIFSLILWLLRQNNNNKLTYEELEETNTFKLLKKNALSVAKITIITIASYTTWYVPFVLVHSILEPAEEVPFREWMESNAIFLIIDLFLIYIIGRIVEFLNYKIVMAISAFLLTLSFAFIFPNINNFEMLGISMFKMLIIILGVTFLCPHHYYFRSLFDNTKYRYLLIGISISLGAALLGRAMPFICFLILSMSKSITYVGYFLASLTLSSLLVILIPDRTRKKI